MKENNAAQAAEQDDIIQPVLTDDEIIKHMEDAGVTFMWIEGRNPLRTTAGSQRVDTLLAGIRALLSKQIAPVADAPQMRRALEGMLAVFACGAPQGESPTIDAARAALASAHVAVPDGWKLVPIEPTPEMEDAGINVPFGQDDSPPPATVYAAMIGAAPDAPVDSAPVAGEAQKIAHWKRDSELLDAVQDGCWDVRFLSSPNSDAGDSSIGVEIVSHFMAPPRERVIGENWNENLRAAIEQAMTADSYPPARPERASAPVADERAAVAYLDLGTGGYMDVGTDLSDEQLAALPKGRHMLAIIGTHGVNGYTPASAPVAGEAQPSDADITRTVSALLNQARHTRHADGEMGVRVQDVMIARAVLARYGHTPLPMPDAAPQASAEDVRNAALHLLREARALLPAFTTAEAIGAWSEKVRKFGAGETIDVPPQADKPTRPCSCPSGGGSLRHPCAVHPPKDKQ